MKIRPDRVRALHRVLSWDPEIRVWLTDWRRGFGVDRKNLSFTWRAGEADWKVVQPRVVVRIMALMQGGLCSTGWSVCTGVLGNTVNIVAFEPSLPPPGKVILCCLCFFVSLALGPEPPVADSRSFSQALYQGGWKSKFVIILAFWQKLGLCLHWI